MKKFNKESGDILAQLQLQRGHAIIESGYDFDDKIGDGFILSKEDMAELDSLDVGCSEAVYPMNE